MRRFWASLCVIVLIGCASFAIAFGQPFDDHPPIQAKIQPFSVPVKAQVPVSITLDISTTDTIQTVQVPVLLDVNVTVDLTEVVTTVVGVAEASAEVTTVVEVVEESPELISTSEPDVEKVLVDISDTAVEWGGFSNGSSEVEVESVSGRTGNVLGANYEVSDGGYAILSGDVDSELLADSRGIQFNYKVEGDFGNLQVKLILSDEENTQFGLYSVGEANGEDWTAAQALFEDFECWSGSCAEYEGGPDLANVNSLEFVVTSASGTSAQGSITIEDIQLVE